MRLRRLGILMGAAALLGCAGMQREGYVKERTAQHVYAMPLAEIWPVAKALLREKGFVGRDSGAGRYETEWREDMGASAMAASWTRYLLVGHDLPDGGSQLLAFKATRSSPTRTPMTAQESERHRVQSNARSMQRSGGARTGSRDLAFEWELLERIEPGVAAALRREAEERFR